MQEIGEPIDVVAYYSRGHGIRKAMANNATTLISLGLFLMIAVKIYAVARGNGQTMLALTQHFSTAQIGAAILIGLSPYILQFVYRLFNAVVESHRHPKEVVRWFWTAYVVGLVLSVGLLPYWVTLAALIYPLAIFSLHGLESRTNVAGSSSAAATTGGGIAYTKWMLAKHEDTVQNQLARSMNQAQDRLGSLGESDTEQREEVGREINRLIAESNARGQEIRTAKSSWQALRLALGFGVVFYFIIVTSSPRPWLPLERLTLPGRTEVGYVLSEEGKWTEVLIDDSRLVTNLESEDVVRREYCTEAHQGRGRTLVEVIKQDDPAQYPPC